MITLEKFNNKIRPFGLIAEERNNGHQFYIKCPAGVLNFYPKRERWCNEKGQFKQGLSLFLEYLTEHQHRLQKRPMPWREYVCMRVFEFAFADLGAVEEYGFQTWSKLFDYLVDEKVDELRKDNGEYIYLVEEYNCCYIYDVLEQLYDDFVYILQGLNDFNVKLDGV